MSTEERLESLEKKIQKDALFDQIRNLNTPYSEGDLK